MPRKDEGEAPRNAPEPFKQEVVGVFSDRGPFEAAVEALLEAGSAILWVEISHREKARQATTILQPHGGLNVHTCRSTSSNQQRPGNISYGG
ncbi:MAG: hypothetical protein MI741_23995 [Rhodospirillales bacterium]|nr:hypothetical protein [Rhodospirillales bacterium]